MSKYIIKGTKVLLELLDKKSKNNMIKSILADLLSVGCSIMPMFGLYNIINIILRKSDSKGMFMWAGIIFISIILKIIFHGKAIRISHIVAYNTLYNIRKDLIYKFSRLNQGYMDSNSSGKLKSIIFDDIESLEQFYGHHIPEILSSIGIPLVMEIILLILDLRIALVMLIPVIIFLICLHRTNVLQSKNFESMFMTQQNLNASMVEYINAMKEIKIFGGNKKVFWRFQQSADSYKEFMVKWFKDSRYLMTTSDIILSSGIVFVFPVAGYLYINGNIDISKFLLYLFVSLCFYSPLAKIPQFTDVLSINAHIAERLQMLLNMQELKNHECQESYVYNGDIIFDDVSFGYDEKKVIKNLSFTIKKNQVVGLVGPSGGGKSTITKLISRFWDVNEGKIYIDGVDIKEISTENLAKSIAYVTQNVSTFHMSVRDNIKMGKPDATEEEIICAAKNAMCHDFILKLPKGYETLLGEDGINLSGGQKQRIAIARALLKNAPILLLDEATAYMDPDNEEQLQKVLTRLMKNKTVIMIAHRLSTVIDADKILVLDKGVIKEEGNHNDLIGVGKIYKKMWDCFKYGSSWTLRSKEAE
ncbi:ABC transporter ATP-binding protein [Vallitalea sediminicola]